MELCHVVLSTSLVGPDLTPWALPNGVRCVTAAMPEAALTCLDLWCRAGSASEQRGEEGMAHFLEHLVFKGSDRLPAGAFDREIEALGGSSNAATGFDDVHFHVLIPAEQAARALDLLLDLVLHPAVVERDFTTEREVVLEEIAQCADQPDELVLQLLLSRGCPDHAYGRPILGERSSLMAMTPEMVHRFHRRRYRGSNCSLAIAGSPNAHLEEQIRSSALMNLEPASLEAIPTSAAAVHSGRHEIKVDRLESARLLMLWSTAGAADQDVVMGADLATTLLAEGRRSRLVGRLRETLRIAETVDMDLTVLEQGSLITLEICCREEDLASVEQELERELTRSIQEPPAEWELDRARQLVGNGLRFSLESTAQVAGTAGNQQLWERQQDLLQPLQVLNGWSADRLLQELMPTLSSDKACTVIATPGAGA